MMDKWLHKIRLNNCSIWCVSIVLRMWQQDDGVGRVSHTPSLIFVSLKSSLHDYTATYLHLNQRRKINTQLRLYNCCL